LIITQDETIAGEYAQVSKREETRAQRQMGTEMR
jgi:hypothetical protein